MSEQCVLDGQVMPVSQAAIPVTDEGLLRGDGAFEVVRLYAGQPFALDDHMRRMARSAQTLRLEADLQAVHADALTACELADGGDFLLRLVITRGGHRISLLEPMPQHPATLRLAVETHQPTALLHGAKSLSYAANMLAVRLASGRGFDDALFVLPDSRVLEVTRSSFFWVEDERIYTPPLHDDEILDSITRRLVMEENDVTERTIELGQLSGVQEAFSAGTSFEVLGVSEIEHVGTFDAPGQSTQGVIDAVRARVQRELEEA